LSSSIVGTSFPNQIDLESTPTFHQPECASDDPDRSNWHALRRNDSKRPGFVMPLQPLANGFSTFHRSLGVILKQTLDLKAQPRSSGPSSTDTQNFRFDEGEAQSIQWMRDNLHYAHIAVSEDVETVEVNLISSLEPPLNLKGWKNPQKPLIQEPRRACVEEAKRRRSG
jgi:hypothetical protein